MRNRGETLFNDSDSNNLYHGEEWENAIYQYVARGPSGPIDDIALSHDSPWYEIIVQRIEVSFLPLTI